MMACFNSQNGLNLIQVIDLYYNQKLDFIMTMKWTAPISQQIEQQKKRSCLTSLGHTLKRFNPCLRPEKQSETLTKFLEQFKQVSLYDDPYFGQVFLLESLNSNQQILLKKQKLYESEVLARQRQIRQLESFKNNPHIVGQTLIQKIQKISFLWSKFQLYLAYDFIIFDLQKQFQYRLSKGARFSDRQIISIIKGCCKGYIYLQPTDYSSVRMSYIYFTRKGLIKVAHPNLFHYKTNLQNICQHDESKGIYLSPQQMYCLEKGQKDAIMGWKSNSFVFGMVLLSLMSQSHLSDVYDYSSCYINRTKVDQLLCNCKQIYPQKLVNYVDKLIQERPQQRLTFRSLLNKLTNTMQTNNQVELQLLNQQGKPITIDANYGSGMMRPSASRMHQPEHVNYLAGLVYPKIGRAGQFYNESKVDLANRIGSANLKDNNIVAEQRHYYVNRNSYYIGQGKSGYNQLAGQDKSYRQGKGYYKNSDGQLYIGDWLKGQMSGHGKLFWDDKNIRYQGDFLNGKFHGSGTEYNGEMMHVGEAQQEDEPDQTFVYMQRNNWLKYEGTFKNDKREGQGIAYFRNGKWMGNFRDGQPNGQGIFIDNMGKQTKGQWKNGILQHNPFLNQIVHGVLPQ